VFALRHGLELHKEIQVASGGAESFPRRRAEQFQPPDMMLPANPDQFCAFRFNQGNHPGFLAADFPRV